MAQGIVKVTPTQTHPGQLKVTVPDPEPHPNPYKAVVSDFLEFGDPGFELKQEDTVDFALIDEKKCNVTKVLIPAK
jgi:hypothetical protein